MHRHNPRTAVPESASHNATIQISTHSPPLCALCPTNGEMAK